MLALKKYGGFTIIEILIVITLIGIIAGFTYSFAVPRWRGRAYYTRSIAELNTMGSAVKLYVTKYNEYPADVVRDVPSSIKEFIQDDQGAEWPEAPFPGSVYDYENWPADANGPNDTVQVSIRMCNAGDTATCKANARKYLEGYVSEATLNAWDANSSMYYCIKGSCRSHQSRPMTHPGYCINCGGQKNIF